MLSADDPRYHIEVSVRTEYVREQSKPTEGRFVFAYTVTIHNGGLTAAQLINRHWVITDANGKVVGEQPHLKPGESFRYTSGTVLETPVGSMHGTYEMVADDGTRFDAKIPHFSLATPTSLH